MNLSEVFKNAPPSSVDPSPGLWDPHCAKVYGGAIQQIKAIIQALPRGKASALSVKPLIELVDQVLAMDQKHSDILLSMAGRSTPDVYLYAHCVNVCVFALKVGQTMGLAPEELKNLGVSALLHDVGMVKKLPLVLEPVKLTREQLLEVQEHSTEGASLLEFFIDMSSDLKTVVAAVVLQTHERSSGRGYPRGLVEDQIHPLARIVSVCDFYEAITHPRPHRDRMLPHLGIQVLLESSDDDFDASVVNAAVESLSLYPPGSFVQLNDGSIGRVMVQNKGLPTRPKLRLILDEEGNRLHPIQTQDLAADALFFIREAVDETMIATPDKRLALQLRAQRWWVEGL